MSMLTDLFPALRHKWLRVPLGAAATGLACALAFTVGQNIGEIAFGGESEAIAAPAAAPAKTAVPVAKPAPQPAIARADEPFVVKRVLDIDGPIKFGEFYWDDKGVPDGPIVITVDLTHRTMSVFRGGYEIGATAILKGYKDKPTPTGVFPITQKNKDHVSNIYDAPMPYMMRLTNDGVAIHGSKVELGYATNGCVGVPEEFARRVFEQAQLGDKVIITDGKRLGLGEPIIS